MDNLRTSFARLNLKKNGRFLGYGTSPEADWRIIFASTAILAVLIIGLSAFIFIKIDRGEIFVVKESAEQGDKTLDLSLLKETVSYYQNKALEFERIKRAKTSAADPSL